jgi:hypothetical protein
MKRALGEQETHRDWSEMYPMIQTPNIPGVRVVTMRGGNWLEWEAVNIAGCRSPEKDASQHA